MSPKKPVLKSSKAKHFAYQARLFRHDTAQAFFSPIIARDDTLHPLKQTHFAFKDKVMNAAVHHFEVVVIEGRQRHPFQISCKSPIFLRRNKAIAKIGGLWRGDIVVLRIGKRDPKWPVDMRGKDAQRVNYAVRKFVNTVDQYNLWDEPKHHYFRRW